MKKKITSLADEENEENIRLIEKKNSQDTLINVADDNNNTKNNTNLNDINSNSKMHPSKIDQILMIAYNKIN